MTVIEKCTVVICREMMVTLEKYVTGIEKRIVDNYNAYTAGLNESLEGSLAEEVPLDEVNEQLMECFYQTFHHYSGEAIAPAQRTELLTFIEDNIYVAYSVNSGTLVCVVEFIGPTLYNALRARHSIPFLQIPSLQRIN